MKSCIPYFLISVTVVIFLLLFSLPLRAEKLHASEIPEPSINPDLAVNSSFTPRSSAIAVPPNQEPLALKEVSKTFEGFGFDDNPVENDGFSFIPPDPIGAAGTNRVIAVVNSMIEARTKGGSLKWREGLHDFFLPLAPVAFPFDPKIIYDHYEDRFVVVALELSVPTDVSRILLAVSRDGNPQSALDWHFQAINSNVVFDSFNLWADFPGFEADEEAIYVTANMFTFEPFGFFAGVRLWIIDKGAGTEGFYDGGAVAHSGPLDPYAASGIPTTTMPAQVFGEGGVDEGIGTFLVSYTGLSDGVDEFVQIVRVDDPLGTPTFTAEFVNIGNIENFSPLTLPDAPQLGTTALIEVNDRRALDAVWRDDSLWFVTTINPFAGSDAGQTTAHWIEFDTTAVPAGAIVTADQGNIGGEDIAPGTFTYYPAVAVNRSGMAKFGFSASAPTIFAGAFVTGRETNDPPGTVAATEVVKAGEDIYLRTFGDDRNRWGDYTGISVDPTNDKFFWVFNEFADQRGSVDELGHDGRWGTVWGHVK